MPTDRDFSIQGCYNLPVGWQRHCHCNFHPLGEGDERAIGITRNPDHRGERVSDLDLDCRRPLHHFDDLVVSIGSPQQKSALRPTDSFTEPAYLDASVSDSEHVWI
jgi:hypothetical protein